ncbi:MAG: amino acid ABC transporter ATP-binding protein [Clostridia bacterium]|nr:amino acid ABC transporter ATP-binding protein [Clostridia bacterium]
MAYLSIKNFYKKFGQTEVLKGIDVDIEKGEVLTIIGSSGSGKTTLLRCINFLEMPDDGIMTLGDTELFNPAVKDTEKTLRDKRLNFGLVFQSFNLFPQYNVLDNVKLAPSLLLNEKAKGYKKQLKGQKEFTRREIAHKVHQFKEEEKAKIEKDALELLEKTGLTEKAKAYPCELSGGQQQRVAIARALALKPKILCFDEPTSALDPELTGEVLKVIKSLKDQDRTMIIVTHEMGFAKSVSDKVIFMADGVVEEVGTAEEIFDSSKSEKLQAFLSNVKDKDGEQ